MNDLLAGWLPNWERGSAQLFTSLAETVQMTLFSGAIAFVLGVGLGVLLVTTRRGGILASPVLYTVLDKSINVVRSVPFLILIFILFPVSRLIMGQAVGVPGAIVPLVVGTVPFFARQIEVALSEVDAGLIEASQAMGLTRRQIITRVYLRESVPGIARVTQVTGINLVALTVIAGAVGAGGLGNFAIQFGLQRGMQDLQWVAIAVILVLVTLIQATGNVVIKKTTR